MYHAPTLRAAFRGCASCQELLTGAVASASAVASAEGGLLAECSTACRREVEAGSAARSALAMLLRQAGRVAEAEGHLTALGFTHSLAPQVSSSTAVQPL